MNADCHRLIESIHRSPVKVVLVVTGGGAGAAAQLLDVPGGSRTVLEVRVPYGEQALAEFLGGPPAHYCSAETAGSMAQRASARAAWLAPRERVVGLACTASLVTDRPKKGAHRCHIAVHDGRGAQTLALTLAKGARDRSGEEAVVDVLLLNALAEASGVPERLPVPLLPGEQVETGGKAAGTPLPVCVLPDGRWRTDAAPPALLVPGSFNPVHAAHRALAEVAARRTGAAAAFEISVANVDKPPLDLEEVSYRLTQFAWRAPVWLTLAPTFAEKARLFPGAAFAIGCDTAARIVDPRYYQDSPALMSAALEQIRVQGCRFLVAGRVDAAGVFQCCDDLPIPAEFRDLFAALPESEFRWDVSSTELRQRT